MLFDKAAVQDAKEGFLKQYSGPLDCAVVLGSGLGEILSRYEKLGEIGFETIPHLKSPKVEGHKNKFLILKISGKTVLVMQGRVHLYEGYSAFEVCLPVALAGELGVESLILTNAAGGIHNGFQAGDIMMILDHINLQCESPLTGMEGSAKFTDLSQVYSQDVLQKLVRDFDIQAGVYAGVRGPNYETPAEIRYLRAIGADAVGMSTVMEAIMAKYYKMKVFGFSLITNLASGMEGKLSHSEVIEAGKKGGQKLLEVIEAVLKEPS